MVVAGQEAGQARLGIDTTKPHPARMYDYFLGGKNNFAVDRETAEKALKSWGTARTAARENRAFLGRAVRYLVAEVGIRQFLDIGTGLPSANNVHEVAQNVASSCRVVYVDNDPIVLAHARALLTSAPEGKTAYIHADFREPERVLADPATRQTLDFTKPIALMLVAILHFVPDEAEPRRVIQTLLDALPSGSYLMLQDGTLVSQENPDALTHYRAVRSPITCAPRNRSLASSMAWNSSNPASCRSSCGGRWLPPPNRSPT